MLRPFSLKEQTRRGGGDESDLTQGFPDQLDAVRPLFLRHPTTGDASLVFRSSLLSKMQHWMYYFVKNSSKNTDDRAREKGNMYAHMADLVT